MKRFFSRKAMVFACVLLSIVMFGYLYFRWYTAPIISPLSSNVFEEYIRTLDKYSFERLRARQFEPTPIVRKKVLIKNSNFTSYEYTNTLQNGAVVSGLMNIPTQAQRFPVILMIRGYVDKEIYETGMGTKRSAEAFAENGYLTIAPDFLGYGKSSSESADILEARFEKPATILQLIASLSLLDKADQNRIGIWGHSNGGQIALSVLEITQQPFPTTLWAPVSLGFPESIFAFIDDLPDKGTYIQSQLNQFHDRYVDKDYSISNNFADLSEPPLQLHQGLQDEAVLPDWSKNFVEQMQSMGKEISYFEYANENHHFNYGSFNTLIARDIRFFNQYLK